MVQITLRSKEIKWMGYKGLNIATAPDDNFFLHLVIVEGVPTVDITTPWNTTLKLGDYPTQKEAEVALDEFDRQLKHGYRVRLKQYSAELVPPEDKLLSK